jgi:amino acid transporter
LTETPNSLVRTIGRWSLSALMFNTVIGGGIFGLPSVVSGRLGSKAPLAYLVAGAGIFLIAGCFSEVASQFDEAGGPYLYARETLGRFWGVQIAWMTWLSRIAAASGTADLFTTYLAQVYPPATERFHRAFILIVLIGILAAVNYVGVKSGTRVSDFFTVTKIALLLIFITAGLAWLATHGRVLPAPLGHGIAAQDWLQAVLVLVYAYGGFEAVLIATAEMKNPRRDVPVALFVGLGSVAVIYTLVQVVVSGTLANPAATPRPLAESAFHIFGASAAAAIAIGALISIYGYLSANMLHTPRLTYALAEQRDLPKLFAAVHPKFRTPHISILVYTGMLLAFALAGSFQWNITLSAIARLFTYSSVAIAMLVLRKRDPGAVAFRLPGGTVFAVLAIGFCLVLLARTPLNSLPVVVGTSVCAFANWAMVRKQLKPA